MTFKTLRDLAVRGFLPKIIAREKVIKCPVCEQGKK